jgi:hypothetical protein
LIEVIETDAWSAAVSGGRREQPARDAPGRAPAVAAAVLRFGGTPPGDEGRPGAPADIGAVAAFWTEDGSRGAGAGNTGNLHDDRVRCSVGVGKALLDLDVYSTEGEDLATHVQIGGAWH